MGRDQIWNGIIKTFEPFKNRAMEFVPQLAVALLILLAGLLVARFFRFLSYRLLKNLGRLIPHRIIQNRLPPHQMEHPALIISNIFYWIIIFLFITAATEMLGLPVVTRWLSGIASYLPQMLTAVLIIFLGFIGARLLRDIVATSMGALYGNLLGKLAQYTLLLVTILIGIGQMGIHIAFLTNLILIVTAAILFGAALAFGLGARNSISNILGSYYLQKAYKVGQRVRIATMEGEITQISSTAVFLEGAEGTICLPAKEFGETASVLLKEGK